MDSCLFCKIVRKEIPATVVYEDERVLAFEDIAPVAPVHILIIPKEHISSIAELSGEKAAVAADIFRAATVIAKDQDLLEAGYRVVVNCGEKAGQTVDHVHFHLLGGRDFSWPPG